MPASITAAEATDSAHYRALGRSAWLKVQGRILAPLLILTILSSLDRANISFAALQLNSALGLTPEQYGVAVGIFFVAYLMFQYPSTWLQRRIGTRLWILCIGMSWGVAATAMSLVDSRLGLYTLRFILGVAEAGLAPGIVFYCNSWLPRERRAAAITLTMLAIPLSVVLGGPLCGWLLAHSNPLQLAPWRWMMLVEGVPTLIMAGIAYQLLTDHPQQAYWLRPAERAWLCGQLSSDPAPLQRPSPQPQRALRPAGIVWRLAIVWFALLLGSNGILFWLPQVLQQFSGRGAVAIGFMSAVPWLGVGIGMLVNAWHSDRTQERSGHVMAAMLFGGVALGAAALVGAHAVTLALLFLAGCGIGAAQGTFWAIPGNLWRGSALGIAVTSVNLLGNVASLVGPYLIGALRSHTGSFTAPAYGLAACLLLGAAPLLAVRKVIGNERMLA